MNLPGWKTKAVVQKAVSFLPAKEKINFLFQKHVTKGILLSDSRFEEKLIHARDHLRFFGQYGSVHDDFHVLELGTGWYPVIPIGMYLSGAGHVVSADIRSWMTTASMLETIRKFLAWRRSGRIVEYLPDTRDDRWWTLEHIAANERRYGKEWICGGLRLTLLVGDARNSGIPSGSIDYVCSNNTFEHVHEEVLRGLLGEFRRLIKRGGVMSHFIDMSDHFAHTDGTITIYNFLKFDDRTWRRIDNDIQPQNRMRLVDYRNMYASLGLPITEETCRPGNVDALRAIRPAAKYAGYSPRELAISHAHLVTRM